ncbi:hypothetical protein BGZ95_003153 [Linnemannia exigua]|uniref:Uncharacterized protein n=1 Tax=Linnemannia exigua TaxID=604196 RepID=A0AAD4DJU0_9FUNG|nr:hypothetical protein BGZ95_003153 [Linnemannia exigua]
MTHLLSSSTPLTGETLANNSNKRVSEYEFPTAVKVDLPYQSYINHPYNQQSTTSNTSKGPQPHSQIQKPQAYVSKYNSYTNSSKTMRLITIPSSTSVALSAIEKAKGGRLNDLDLNLNSPTSPLVSPPPPYLHSDQSELKFGVFSDKKNKQQQQRQSVQWPSMMQISSTTGATTATVTRPKLARMPPQAISILPGGHLGTTAGADESGPVKLSSPRVGRLMESGESETLYNLQMSDDYQHHNIGTTSSAPLSASTTVPHPQYPTFWEDARQTKVHWAFLSFGCVLLGSVIWVLVMQVFIVEWAMVMPAATLGLLALQFGRYRWKRSQYIKQQTATAVCMHSRNTTSLQSVVTSEQQHDTDPFLEPHQPRDYYQHAYQHQQAAMAAITRPQVHPQQQQHVTFQDAPPSPSTTELQFNQHQYKQPRLSQMAKKLNQQQQQQRRPLTVNPGLYRATVSAAAGTSGSNQVNNGSPYYQNPQFLSPVDSPQTPPPAYFLKNIELPKIDSVGDLVSEFECDLGSIQY